MITIDYCFKYFIMYNKFKIAKKKNKIFHKNNMLLCDKLTALINISTYS